MLNKKSDSNVAYLEVKHNRLWRQVKKQVVGCDEIEVTNPKTGQKSIKYGFSYDSVSGHAVKIVKYDTEKKYPTRYFGFKLHLVDGADSYVIDMAYNGAFLRRFLKICPNVNWSLPLSITIFKGKKQDGSDELGVWFQQQGQTVKPYYTRENPHGMPEAVKDPDLQTWDFKAQHRWLIENMKANTIPAIEATAPKNVAPAGDEFDQHMASQGDNEENIPPNSEVTEDDCPF